jgi:drug/metabolite transporter superfamily protein YnfA
MDKKEENDNSRINWRSSPIYLWNYSNTATSKLSKSICSIWWSIHIFIYYLGALIDRKRPDKYEIVGSLIVILGAAIIYYSRR